MESNRLSPLGMFCDRVLEAGWLLAVTVTPVFFNVYSSRVFEPDKLTTMRAIATLMAVFWLVRYVDARSNGSSPMRFSWQTPMVLPALATMTVYVISSLFSVVGRISVYGSYQRLQGLYTTTSYLVIFIAMITSLRSRTQLSRLVTVLILNSVPVALYGIVQHTGQDPLPWAGDVVSRVASNMGNAIFVAAYLIMIVPLTAARLVESVRDIMLREDFRVSDILRTGCYLALIVTQVITIFYSGSRGPWVGLAMSIFLFPYMAFLILQRRAMNEESTQVALVPTILKSLALGLGSIALAGGVFIGILSLFGGKSALSGGENDMALLISLGAAGTIFCALWIYFVIEKKGWQWLWLAWLWIGAILFGAVLLINIPGPLQDEAREISVLERMTTITEFKDGTGKVRGLIWQGAIDLISVHEPLEFPDGSTDTFNFLRPLVGYGPESMYVAYNSFYPPDLGHHESRTASPDRSHNETLDSLVITGILGFAVYLFTFGSVFVWTLKWLRLISNRKQLLLFIGLCVVSAIILFVALTLVDGPYLFAIAVPMGLVFGMGIYLVIVPIRLLMRGRKETLSEETKKVTPHAIWLIGVFIAVLAHFVEINVGIAIAATRTTFWALVGMLVVMGQSWVPSLRLEDATADAESASVSTRVSRGRLRRKQNKIPSWLASILVISLAAGFLMSTLAFDFVNNSDRVSNTWQIFWNSLIVKQGEATQGTYSAFKIFSFTWLVYGLVAISEADNNMLFGTKSQSRQRWWIAALCFVGITLVMTLLFGLIMAGHQAGLADVTVSSIDQVVTLADRLSNMLIYYYVLIFAVLAGMGMLLVKEHRRVTGKVDGLSVALLAGTLLVSLVLINNYCINPIRADVLYKQGKVFADTGNVQEKQVGILHYERALEYMPHEDYYLLFLGKAYLELAQTITEVSDAQREGVFLETEQVLQQAREENPLNTDHSANLARFYKSWATRLYNEAQSEGISDADRQTKLNQRAILLNHTVEEYETALMLSPNNVLLWNELAQLYAVDFQDLNQAEMVIDQSVYIDSTYFETWLLLGRIRTAFGDITGAEQAYEQALIVRDRCVVREEVSVFYVQQGFWLQAEELLVPSIEQCPDYANTWLFYHALAITYGETGRMDDALSVAQMALVSAPEQQKSAVQGLIEDLQLRLTPPEDMGE